jgi:aromatase
LPEEAKNMTELRIWTARHTIRVAAPPKRVFQLVANIDRWPELFDSTVAVEHLGFEGANERVRFWEKVDGELVNWTSVREHDPKRMRVRFRKVDFRPPLASMGGLWLVVPKGQGSVIGLDHYYRVLGDDARAAAMVEQELEASITDKLESLRRAAEFDGGITNLIDSYPDVVNAEGDTAA